MRYVMVPVPSEYVLDVMRWVLFRAPDEDSDNGMRDGLRLKNVLEEADELTRSLLVLVAKATIADNIPVRLTDAAEDLGQDAATLRAALRDLNLYALEGGRTLVKVSNEAAVGVHGRTGKISFLAMRPDHARLVRAAVKAIDARGE